MSFRDGLLKMADEPLPFKIVSTRFGDVKIVPPMAGRVDEFRRFFGDKAAESMNSQGVLVALSSYDPETGNPLFTAADVAKLNKLPAGAFNSINEAIGNLSGAMSLDPTTPETGTGSVSDDNSGVPLVNSAAG
jgi:hypothetical protein